MLRAIASRLSAVRFLGCLMLVVAALALLNVAGCPRTPDNSNTNTNDNSSNDNTNDNTSNDNTNDNTSNDNTNDNTSNTNTNGSIDNGNTSGGTVPGNDNGGDDVTGDDSTAKPTTVTLEQIVQTGDAVPGQADATFTDFGSPIIDADGRVAFWALYDGANGHGGLYVWDAGELKVVVDDDPARTGTVPGGTANENYGTYSASSSYDPLAEAISWGAAGRLLFTTPITEPGGGRTALLRWRASDENLIVVADSAMIKEGLGITSDLFISYFANFGVSDDGLVVFRTRYTGLGGTVVSGNAVCTSNGLAVTPLAVAGDAVPDQVDAAYFTSFNDQTTISPAGFMLFQGQYTDGDGDHGLYISNNGGTPQRVIDNRPSSVFPGLPTGSQVGTTAAYYDVMAIGSNDHMAVETTIDEGGTTRQSVIVWDWTLLDWTELYAGTTRATDLLSGVSDGGAVLVLAGGKPYIINPTASVALTTQLPTELSGVDVTWLSSGGAINNNGRAILRYNRTSGNTPGLAFWTNDELLVLADPAAGVPAASVVAITADSRPENDRPGRTGILNDNDVAVFRVVFDPDGEAIYVGRAE